MNAIQLDFFETDEVVLLRYEVQSIKASTERVRRGIYSKHTELKKDYRELKERLELLERFICASR